MLLCLRILSGALLCDMSVSVRKKSWEDHVSQWIGLSSNPSGCDKLCCHGIKVDNLKTAMEEHGKEDIKETECISLEDCNGFLDAEEGIFKEIDENDNLDREDHSASSNTSIETVMPPNEKELKIKNEDRLPNQDGISSLAKTFLEEDMSNTLEVGNTSVDEEEDTYAGVQGRDSNYELKDDNVNVFDGISFNEMLHGNMDLEEMDMSGEQLLNSARIAQQRRKSDGSKVVYEHNICSGASTDSCDSLHFCVSSHLETKGETRGYQNVSPLCRDTKSHDEPHYEMNGDLNVSQDGLQGVSSTNCAQSIPNQDNMSTCEVLCDQVRLRRKKKCRQGRDPSRLDSMVLLIMKLDQLDQDIDNALSSPSLSRKEGFSQRYRQSTQVTRFGSENAQDISPLCPPHHSISQVQTVDYASPAQVLACGAKPKASAQPVISEKEKGEIEAKEACDWLRAAGFPQYAQLYEDLLFPIDISAVKKDHDFLDRDAIEALCRRLNTLNKCAVMKLEISPNRKKSDDSDEDEPCAISGKWTFQRDSKRWSRLEEFDVFQGHKPALGDSHQLGNAISQDSILTDLSEHQEVSSIHSTSSDSQRAHVSSEAGTTRTNSVNSVCSSGNFFANDDSFSSLPSPKELSHFNFNIKANEKNSRSRTKSLLKRMESLKIKTSQSKKKSQSKTGLTISEPILQEGVDDDKLKQLNCVEITSLNGNHINAPKVRKRSISNSTQTSSSSSQSETSSAVSTPSPVTRTRSLSACHKRVGMYLEGFDPFNQSTFSDVLEQNFRNQRNFGDDAVFFIPEDHKPGTFPKALSNGNLSPTDSSPSVSWRNGSFHAHDHLSFTRENSVSSVNSCKSSFTRRRRTSCCSEGSRLSIYDNVPGTFLYSSNGGLTELEHEDIFPELDDILYHVKGMQRIVNQWTEKFYDEDSDSALDSVSPCPSSPKQIHLDIDNDCSALSDLDSTGNSLNDCEETTVIQGRRDSGVGASLTRSNRHRFRWHSFQSSHRPSLRSASLQINCQSVTQINLLQKYSLLKLTALLERYTPSNKHGFSWAVPKFMKRVKVPDYRDKNVFGVPLPVNVQRSGQPLPQNIQQAMRYLRSQCLDQVGLFRKSGVKSRILALREISENSSDPLMYEGQSAYDVADMLKQYFRDLPEPLLTNKLSETFLQIYQYVPKDQRLQAIKAAIMLLPDENREVLQTLLFFLSDVAAAVDENQMTPTNLAVCLAPSLFHLNTLKRENSSPRVMQRKQSLGKPDQKDLNENLAATQGLAHMIAECKKLFQIPEEMNKCRNSYTEQDLRPVCLEELVNGNAESQCDYQSYLQEGIDSLLKEAKDKFKGWVSCSTSEQADLAYKKIPDGPPLRLWKSTIEIPAQPEIVLQRLLKEQHMWDEDLLDSRVVETLDEQTDIYQYVQNNMAPHPARDFVVLRSWRTNLPKGACALQTTSVEHDQAPLLGVRVNVLLSKYLIEPCSTGKSKLTYLCRADMRGHMPEWYHKVFGQLCAAEIVRIRDSFTNPQSESNNGKSR
ncbi:rho GTPase-activating protein 7 isoform X1 [Bufo bufo]|uniref:rho GTPase-activating protein 7 isoform X1 n=1 Tax=Bufo bufo TaxID=8384 RepID=UPI001ABEBD65|nr:rho GTPase-activating protein 7 isoform X1 [Bufo bufo]XP_040274743.1 rho GTPase-activating protein 7 isoform X1 [Bufo bufo]